MTTLVKPAIFISKQGAARALIEVAREYGLRGAVLASKGRIPPRTVRGAIVGYTASVRLSGGSVAMILEN